MASKNDQSPITEACHQVRSVAGHIENQYHLAQKLARLESEKSDTELANSEEYDRMRRKFRECRGEVREACGRLSTREYNQLLNKIGD